MFATNLRRLFFVSDKIIVRTIRNRKFPSHGNPGLNKRINAFKEENLSVDVDDAEEYLEQSESDFYKTGEVYSEHLNETLMGKLEMRKHIIKEKYFKENMPNLLTWSEKEQIRHLATTSPDEWPPERIAESFPVTVLMVKKLLKYPWQPATEQRIARHDASAMRNWKELKENTFDIPEDLRKHFLKFSERTIPPLSKKSVKIDVTPTEDLGEFERIIHQCAMSDEKSEQKNNFSPKEQATLAITESDTRTKSHRSEKITLDELTSRIRKRLDKGDDVSIPDKMLSEINYSENNESTNEELSKEIKLFDESGTGDLSTEIKPTDNAVIKPKDYPLRIRIPKKAYKRAATYKIDDCYYDHDGKFLYRVLGIGNQSDGPYH